MSDINEAQLDVLAIRGWVESLFIDDTIPHEALGTMAHVHGLLSKLAMKLNGWTPPLPPRVEQPGSKPKAVKPKAAQRKRRKNIPVSDRMAATCSKCGAQPGYPCVKMDTGQPPKPVEPIRPLAGERPFHLERGQ